MSSLARTLIAAILLVPVASESFAKAGDHIGHDAVTVPDAASVVYEPGPANLPKGTQISRVAGDPAKVGPFVLRIKFPADTVIAPHTHAQAETLTILAGSIYHQHGATLNKERRQGSARRWLCLPATGDAARPLDYRRAGGAAGQRNGSLRPELHRPGR
jgi:hypothetical protein